MSLRAERSIHVRLPVETIESIRALADLEGIDVARYTRSMIRDCVHGKWSRYSEAVQSLTGPPKDAKPGHIYVVKCGQLYKIGRSKKPAARIRSMQLPEPSQIVVTIETSDPRLEKRLHAEYASKRQHGEWFRLSEADLIDIGVLARNQVKGPDGK